MRNGITKVVLAVVIVVALVASIFVGSYASSKNYLLSDIGTSDIDCLKNGDVCEVGTKVSLKVNDNKTYDFYVISDDGKKTELIMNKNIVNGFKWGDSNLCDAGPDKIIRKIEEVTSSWNNILERKYTFKDSNKCYSEISTYLKARILTKEEAESLGCTYAQSETCPEYLIDNLDENNYGYWLSTTKNDRMGMMVTWRNGIGICDLKLKCYKFYGIRLVIEINK